MALNNLEGKVAVITGGASGIGAALTTTFVERGAKVVFVDIQGDAGRALEADLGGNAHFVEGDVSLPEVAEQAVAKAVGSFGKLDTLVNNAHASRQAPFVQLTQEQWDLSFNSGFVATRNFMLAAYEALKEQGGSVVNFASGAGLEGQPTQAAYAAAKEAIRGLSRVVANEWAADEIRVNVVCPKALTEGVRMWAERMPEMYQDSLHKVPLGRFGDPAGDVAPIVAFLCSDDSKYMTGQTVMADGGSIKLR